MKWLSEDFKNLHALYVNQLRVLLSAEEQIVRAIPDLIVRATDEQLRNAFMAHLHETEAQIKRLEGLLSAEKAADPTVDSIQPERCGSVTALIDEAHHLIKDARDAWVRDAALIAAAQRLEHYEIAAYGTVRQWALVLGDAAAVDVLDRTLKEEGHADHLLTSIAERVNTKAKAA